MTTFTKSSKKQRGISGIVRSRIENGGERLWRLNDFREFSFVAVAQALSRLTRAGEIERIKTGVYYRAKPGSAGKSRKILAAIEKIIAQPKPSFVAGVPAAILLGFTDTNTLGGRMTPTRRKRIGPDSVIYEDRPPSWTKLSETDTALLGFLRRWGASSELSAAETIRRTLALLAQDGRYERLVQVADTEPPRVRAMLGALGEELHCKPQILQQLRRSLNPICTFDFGLFVRLPKARDWQARKRR